MNMQCTIEAKGDVDRKSGEFWVENPFEMLSGKHNFSAYESNKFFLNKKDEPFVDLSYESGADIDSDSRGVIAADFDRDGDMDLLVSNVGGGSLRLFLNQIPSENHRVQIKLNPTKGNRDGIGSRVIAHIGDQQILRDVFPSNGFMGQTAPELILGTGDASKIDKLTVRWPDGTEQEFADVPVDCQVEVKQNDPELTTKIQAWDR